MLLQDRDALGYALVTDMCGCARHKACNRVGLAAAKRAAQTARTPRQQASEDRKALHVSTLVQRQAGCPTQNRIRPFLAMPHDPAMP
jgi:hypothetical protein